MALAKLGEQYEFLPLHRYLQKAADKGWTRKQKEKNMLLSQVKQLDRDIVQRLEMVGIFETDEFLSVQNEMEEYLGSGIDNMLQIIKNEIKSEPIHPVLDLDMKDNFVFIAFAKGELYNAIAMIANEVMFTWHNPVDDGWNLTKYAFDKIYANLNRPELLSSLLNMNDTPSWLKMVDLSVYISGLDPLKDLFDQAELIGFPKNPHAFSAIEIAQNRVLKLKYIYEASRKNRDKKYSEFH